MSEPLTNAELDALCAQYPVLANLRDVRDQASSVVVEAAMTFDDDVASWDAAEDACEAWLKSKNDFINTANALAGR